MTPSPSPAVFLPDAAAVVVAEEQAEAAEPVRAQVQGQELGQEVEQARLAERRPADKAERRAAVAAVVVAVVAVAARLSPLFCIA